MTTMVTAKTCSTAPPLIARALGVAASHCGDGLLRRRRARSLSSYSSQPDGGATHPFGKPSGSWPGALDVPANASLRVGLAQIGPAQVGPAQVGPAQVGPAEVGPAQGG